MSEKPGTGFAAMSEKDLETFYKNVIENRQGRKKAFLDGIIGDDLPDITEKINVGTREMLAELKDGESQPVVFWEDPELKDGKTYAFYHGVDVCKVKALETKEVNRLPDPVWVVEFAKAEDEQ